MKPDSLVELLGILQTFGVTDYETNEIKLHIAPKPAELPKELQQALSTKLTDDEMLFNPMKGLEGDSNVSS